MTASGTELAAFPSPYSIETPPGCEGWEEMYPYWALFDERRRETDENRFWFWNSMHFPVPMPAFDVICIDSPYRAVGAWQNRVFAVPPAMGIDYRAVNGYIYISGNPVTDPDKIAERAEFFQKRAGYYFENWNELYAKWRDKMEALNREITELEVPDLPEYEPDEVTFGDRDTSHYKLLTGYNQALGCAELMWQHHFEFLLLGYGAYLTFADFCKGALPDIPDQHIAQMVAGIDVLLFRPDAELRRLARLAIDTGVDSAFVEGRSPAEIDAELSQSEAGRSWLEELEKVKDPWFNMATGDGLYHYYGSWLDDPSIPYASLIGHIGALQAGEDIERPTEELERERDRLAEEYEGLMDEDSRGHVPGAARALPHGLPVRRGAQVLLRLLVPVALLQQDPRVRRPARGPRLPRGRRGRLPALPPRGPAGARGAEPRVGHRRDRARPRPLAADRGAAQGAARAARRLDPPPALGAMPEAVNDPMAVMLWGVTPQRLQDWARAQDDAGSELTGAAASRGQAEGPARVVRTVDEISSVRAGEILVCTITSPAWAPIFSKIEATVTDIGGIMSHAAIVSREYGLPAVVGTGTATTRIHTGQRLRVDGSTGVVTILDGDAAS